MSQTTTQQAQAEVASTATLAPEQQMDVLDQLMKPEIQESLNVLVANLPKLAEMTTILTKTYDLVQTVANDQVLIEDIKGGVEEFVKPISDKAKGIAQAAIEANDRAHAEESTIGLFGMLKMLKDPQVQKTLRFAQAFLEVLAERQQQKR
ncbi:hypothetical protein BAG01nite_10210 [Brevibacillus agri]|uniref:DUF1641 domain-containing protein n=1 Tax=Brevibacillus agri TaxID=51101 RepID=A0A3M8AVV1_9BACL|nr:MULTISPECIES: DUF1641 domain-containing protein [Brevibacillus]ELK41066.1 hypothetical protein D478_15599 [Brevibacillus agri BAB-2500]EJL43825.1 hypothetical protein PMI08_02372 [Brevibacillus sp. CF112]MBG9566250.1 hypothetical protein [Brevibacillus agri]MBY0053252.1 DUF1641 domain-containing protein [Brevibacillus agri]MCG5250611.1 DUF1641 domain-containing protein [Brevibacillus agri]